MVSFVCTENKLKVNNVASFAGSHHNFHVDVYFDVADDSGGQTWTNHPEHLGRSFMVIRYCHFQSKGQSSDSIFPLALEFYPCFVQATSDSSNGALLFQADRRRSSNGKELDANR